MSRKKLILTLFGIIAILCIAIVLVVAYAYYFLILPYPRAKFNGTPDVDIYPERQQVNDLCFVYFNMSDFITSDSVGEVTDWLADAGWQLESETPVTDFQTMYKDYTYTNNTLVYVFGGSARFVDTRSTNSTYLSTLDIIHFCVFP